MFNLVYMHISHKELRSSMNYVRQHCSSGSKHKIRFVIPSKHDTVDCLSCLTFRAFLNILAKLRPYYFFPLSEQLI